MADELRKPIKWDRPCYKCKSYYCDLSCPEPVKNYNAAPEPVSVGEINEAWKVFKVWFGNTDWTVADAANYRIIFGHGYNFGAARNVAPDAWTSVKAAMPQSGVTVLAYYKNSNGFERRIRAKWTAAKTVEANAEYGWGEYDEAADAYWTPEGWYECIDNWDEYSSVMVSEGEVTHWMPLPPAPRDPRQAALEQVSRDCQWQASLDDKRDAERYRWLREYFTSGRWYQDDALMGNTRPSEIDEAIDAAMQQEQKT